MPAGTGYQMRDGRWADTEKITLVPSQVMTAQMVTAIHEMGGRASVRLTLAVTAKQGTSPTLDVAVQTSKDGVTSWRSVGTFRQKSDVGLAMEAVVSAGTTPPVITLTGTALEYVDLRIECTSIAGGAARGSWVLRYSTDGGVTWATLVTSAATVQVFRSSTAAVAAGVPSGTDTGLVINIATGNAAVDNSWTSKPAGYEEKVFAGCDRFVRAVAQIGGSASPSMTASVVGERTAGA